MDRGTRTLNLINEARAESAERGDDEAVYYVVPGDSAPKPQPHRTRTLGSLADLLPGDVMWSDPLTPNLLAQILDAYDAKKDKK